MENAASIAVSQLSNMRIGADYYFKTSQYFQTNDAPDRAADSLEKAAKYFPGINCTLL
jgi:hypothetical protein